jgi:hypothetical protein
MCLHALEGAYAVLCCALGFGCAEGPGCAARGVRRDGIAGADKGSKLEAEGEAEGGAERKLQVGSGPALRLRHARTSWAALLTLSAAARGWLGASGSSGGIAAYG